ncbi:gluconokinase [Rhodoferax sp.]|uniref:gluconokinase n=1 Tax=Rhodoferax sp. TaxID=50421 RepID=UPI0025CED61A|nr:gluconokinase [Rhodoferax sp.]
MGVSGCGKSSVAEALCQQLGWAMLEGDAFHSPANKAKMHDGVPLTDEDRAGWLDAVGLALQTQHGGAVASCSALKRLYRERLRACVPGLRFVFLAIDPASAVARVGQRMGSHFFPSTLVDNQFQTLQSPEGEPLVLCLDATRPLAELCEATVAWLATAA